ncbi:MAG TPA: hypothetical protein VJH03_13140 [Blastocatellia bacterium]|nr:hypothetical protein [Blastocatellia bacterium]
MSKINSTLRSVHLLLLLFSVAVYGNESSGLTGRARAGGGTPSKRSFREDPGQNTNNPKIAAVRQYLALPPAERVAAWKKGRGPTGVGQRDMDNALIAKGVDAVPYLCDIVKTGNSYHRMYALKILCEMDRFTPRGDFPLPDVVTTIGAIGVDVVEISGRVNQFQKVDGRRIGTHGYELVKWAAEQDKNQDLRLHAREYAGLLGEEMRRLSLQEAVKQWRDVVARGKGGYGLQGDVEAFIVLRYHLSEVIVENAPDSIPIVTRLLKEDPSGYVREDALLLLRLIDSSRVRLRTSEQGRAAIEAIKHALEVGGLEPVYRNKAWREQAWKEIQAEMLHDELPIDNGSNLAFLAMALEGFYRVKATKRYYTLIEATPEMREFVSYLTRIDPYFPSWEFTYIGLLTNDQALHPGFKQKIARYYEAWKKFKAERGEKK